MTRQDIFGAITGGITGFIGNQFFETWIQPVILSAVCAVIGLLITHYGRRWLNSIDNKRLFPKHKQNGRQ